MVFFQKNKEAPFTTEGNSILENHVRIINADPISTMRFCTECDSFVLIYVKTKDSLFCRFFFRNSKLKPARDSVSLIFRNEFSIMPCWAKQLKE